MPDPAPEGVTPPGLRPPLPPPLPLPHPTLLAPMEGVSHATFRRQVAALGGVGAVCTEFVRITDTPVSVRAMTHAVDRPPGVPLSVQVMGNHVAHMAEAAAIVSDAGADVVDINLGCPSPRVVRKGVGSAMLEDPALCGEVVGAMRARVPGLLSAKIRAGFDRADKVVTIAKALESAGIDFLAVHPRRRCDFYEGVADWRIIRTLVDALDIPVVGNGDVWYAADALRMERETGCAAVMIGRPAIRNPWIFRQISELRVGREPFAPSGDDVVAWFEATAARYREVWNKKPESSIGKLKELVTYLGRALPDGGAWRSAALREGTIDALRAAVHAGFAGRASAAVDLGAGGDLGLENSGSATATPLDERAGAATWRGPSKTGPPEAARAAAGAAR